jgi:gamma-D-glutamyl-L-lysine dipeptidyl-peptidase
MSGNKAIVIKSIVPMKQKPQADSELADEVLFGMEVDVLEEEADWLYVQTSYHYKGYIERNDAMLKSSTTWEKIESEFIIAAFADILSNPSYASNCIITIPRGASIALTGEKQDKWLGVMLPMGEKGWIREEALIQPLQKSSSEVRKYIVETALLYIGTQYRWGGKTPLGIDCSGLSSMAYLLNGVIIPRDSDDQMRLLKKVSRKESKPGDLLFFPGHVAIYIGEDKFIHATGMDNAVKINSLNRDSKLYRKDLDEKYICTGTVF